jgi:O-succinylbenzoate synthase
VKFESIELRRLQMRLKVPFTVSFGTTQDRPVVLAAVRSDGLTGYGECVAFAGPWYSYETADTAWQIMREFLAPRLLEAELARPEDVWDIFAPVRGHNMAKAGIEMAMWDLFARAEGVPLAQYLGGETDRVPVGVSLGIESTAEALVETVRRFKSEGYRRFKLKIGPGADVAFATAARDAFPDDLVQVDANSAYTLADIDVLKSMDHLNLLLIEQPLGPDDIIDHAALQRELQTPVCLDESIHSPDDARHALDLGSCRIINIKAGRVGGHRPSKAIHDLALERGAPLWSGGMFETNVGRAHNVAMASLPGFTLPGDISASDRYYHSDIAGPNFVLNDDSTLTVPAGPGIGVEVDHSALEAVTEAREQLRASTIWAVS